MCLGMSFEKIAATQFGEHLQLVVSTMGTGSMMIYHHLRESISLHLSTSKHVTVFSERCNPTTCKSAQSVCEGCVSMEKTLCASSAELCQVLAEEKASGLFCKGMNWINILWTVHCSNLRSMLTFIRRSSSLPYSYLGDSFVVNSSHLGEISLHSDKCHSTTAISSMVCQECQDLEQYFCTNSLIQPKMSMEISIEDLKLTTRINSLLMYWGEKSRRSCFMATCFPHISGGPEDSTTTLLPFRVNSKLGHFFVTFQDYKERLCSGVVGDPSPIIEMENRRWLNDSLVNVLPWVAQTIAGPNLFVLDSAIFYKQLFCSQSKITCMEQVSDSNMKQLFQLNFPLELMSKWKFIFDKNVTVVFLVHDREHFSNVVFGNLANGSKDTQIPFFAAIDCLISHNRENILHNTKRYYIKF